MTMKMSIPTLDRIVAFVTGRANEIKAAIVSQPAQKVEARNTAPTLNIMCETTSNGIVGTTYLPVIRVEAQDDGSFTAVTDYWPEEQKVPEGYALISIDTLRAWGKYDEVQEACHYPIDNTPKPALKTDAQKVPEGWKLVPVEPTPEMVLAGAKEVDWYDHNASDCYRAMLAAAPKPALKAERRNGEDDLVPLDLAVENARLKTMIVMRSDLDAPPTFTQGYQEHEFLDPVTAEHCRWFVRRIVTLMDALRTARVALKEMMYSNSTDIAKAEYDKALATIEEALKCESSTPNTGAVLDTSEYTKHEVEW